MSIANVRTKKLELETIDAIVSAAEKIDFGQIVIKIQDGKIVQIDSLERKRIGSSQIKRHDLVEYQI